nr:hydroxyethylthiazole kinase [Actinomyces ruminis]
MTQHACINTHPKERPAAAAPSSGPAALLQALRADTPLVACITNAVATNFTANVLLAVGAAPAMVDITGEAGPFAAGAPPC